MSIKRRYSKAKAIVIILIANLLEFVDTALPESGEFYLNPVALNYSVRVAVPRPNNVKTFSGTPTGDKRLANCTYGARGM
jgi:hypothetical protein